MSRAKKSRKIRSAHRRTKRLARTLRRARALVEDQRQRSEARQLVNESDLPPEVKRALGLLVDPLGTAHEIINEVMREAGVPPREEDE